MEGGGVMALQRTIEIVDLTPAELAEEFTNWEDSEQAEFFSHIARITREWPGAGWCQQCSGIAPLLDRDGQEVIAKLAEWAADPYGENA